MLTVTVITPSFMQGSYIKHCIDSVRNQTYPNIHHIIIDANSTDATNDVITSFLGTYDIELIVESDEGPADAINKGLEMVHSDIVCWLNADDTFLNPTTIARVVNLFDDNPQIDWLTGDGYYIDEEGSLLRPIRPSKVCHISLKHMRYSDYMLQPSTFWRRNDLRLDKTLNYTFDWEFFLTMFERGMSVLYIPEFLSCYRIQENSLTRQDTARRKLEIYTTVKKHNRFLPQRAWCLVVYWLYRLAEQTRMPVIKQVVRAANYILRRLTAQRIISC